MTSNFQLAGSEAPNIEKEVVSKIFFNASKVTSSIGEKSTSIPIALSPRKRRASWSTTPEISFKRPRLERVGSASLVSEPPVIFKPRLGAQISQWIEAGSGGPLSVLLNPTPIRESIFQHLTNRDILNLIAADSSSRRTLQDTLKCKPGSDPADYCFPAPNPISGLCSVFNFPDPNSGPLNYDIRLFNNPKTAYEHRRKRLEVSQFARRDPNPPPAPTALTDFQSAPFYRSKDWFWCRRANCPNLGTEKVPCSDCEWQSAVPVLMGVHKEGWKVVCGSCNAKMTKRFPMGYETCSCREDMRKQTCIPCVDRLLAKWKRKAWEKLENWPKGEFETCPCGRLIDGKDRELYQEEVFDSEGRLSPQRMNAVQSLNSWTRFCVVCDRISVPSTATEPVDINLRDYEERWTFKEAMQLGGDIKVDIEQLGRNR